jgi:hypothetical protein
MAMVAFAVFLGSLFHSSLANAQWLFTDLANTARVVDGDAAIDPTILRSRLVGIDWAQVKLALGRAQGRVNQESGMLLNFFQDVVLSAVPDRSEVRSPENFTWHGHVDGIRESEIMLVALDGVMAGNVRAAGRLFQIRYVENGVHAVREIDESRFPPDGDPIPVSLPKYDPLALPDPLAADSAARFDVMVLYTPAARSAAGGTTAMMALVNLAVAETNNAYSRSGVIPRVRLVYNGEVVGYTEVGDFSTDLSRLRSRSDGFIDNIHALRDALGADLVALIIEGNGSLCGLGYIMTSLSASFEANAFSVSARNCATGNYTFSHEMGHNMGLQHDRINQPADGVFPHSHGFVDVTHNFRDIMGVATGCSGCPRIQNFSSPNVLYNGFPTGISQAAANSADAAASINATALTVANWRTQVVPVDFDGNGKSDIAVFRGGAWLFHNFTTGAQSSSVWTGSTPGCIPVVMDYDGDGESDFAQFCNGAWHFYNSDGSYNKGIWTGGVAGDLPVPGDYDGDGADDVVVYRGGAWLFYNFTTGAWDAAESRWTGGAGGCIPAPMDYDGDGTADFTQLCNGGWHFYNDDGSYNKGIWTGGIGDLPAPADYDGDGIDDVVVFRGGAWLFFNFATEVFDAVKSTWTGSPPHWTGGTSAPAPLDYDGDGKADFTVYSGGPWHFYNSNGTYNKGIWTGGVAGDRALSRRLLP